MRGKNINPLGVKYVNTPGLVPEALRSRFASLCEERLGPLEQAVILIKTADRGSATVTR